MPYTDPSEYQPTRAELDQARRDLIERQSKAELTAAIEAYADRFCQEFRQLHPDSTDVVIRKLFMKYVEMIIEPEN